MVRAHLRYLKYLLRHKWLVLRECWKRGLYWQGLVHDNSKFGLSEWNAYVQHFEGKMKHTVLKGKHENSGQDKVFEKAWDLHCRRNRHHPEHWTWLRQDGTMGMVPMPRKYVLEMFCDWIGANIAQGGNGKEDLIRWYEINKSKIPLHDKTRGEIEVLLDQMTYFWTK